jgi:hypothetical protein
MAVDPGIVTVVGPAVDGVIGVTLTGTLTSQAAATLRKTLLKCLTDDPIGLVIEVHGLRVPSAALLSVFPSVLRSHDLPAAIALAAPGPVAAPWAGSRVLGVVTVHETVAEATAYLRAAPRRRHRALPLLPDQASPGAARRFVATACADWGLPQLSESATVVVSELVSNAVEHTGTPIRVTVSHRGAYLYLAVRDGASDSPMPEPHPDQCDPRSLRGRGLYLVDIYATARGVTRTPFGKNVWVSLRATPTEAGAAAG